MQNFIATFSGVDGGFVTARGLNDKRGAGDDMLADDSIVSSEECIYLVEFFTANTIAEATKQAESHALSMPFLCSMNEIYQITR
jgi:hypothetical protein